MGEPVRVRSSHYQQVPKTSHSPSANANLADVDPSCYSMSVEDDCSDYRLPEEDGCSDYSLPVDNDCSDYLLPVEDDCSDYRLPVEDDCSDYQLPEEDDCSGYPMSQEDDSSDYPLPLEADCGENDCLQSLSSKALDGDDIVHVQNSASVVEITEKKVEHSYQKYGQRNIFCKVCDTVIDEPNANNHFKLVHNLTLPSEKEKKYVCEICGLVFSKMGNYNRHMKSNVCSPKIFECNECDFKTENERVLSDHISSHPYKCRYCPYTCKNRNMARHEKSCQLKLFVCSLCSKRCSTDSALKKHIVRVH